MTVITIARRSARARLQRLLARVPAELTDTLAWMLEHRFLVGIAVFTLASLAPLSVGVLERNHEWALLALLVVPAAIVLRGRPRLAAFALVGGGIVLRLAVDGVWNSDQLAVTVAAGQTALNGGNPYGHGYAESWPPGAPFPYGPLALVWGLPGQAIEFAASIATMVLFAATGSWLTLALYAGDNFAVSSATQGVNDLSPGLLIAIAFLLLRKRPLLGGLVLAMAAAIKPYAFAWFPAAIGYAGLPALIGLTAGSVVLWSPLLVWGFGSFVKSINMARAVHPIPNALNVPELRVLGVPLAIAGLWVRSWGLAVAAGTAVFVVVLFFDHWASKGYWLAVIPIAGIALEEWGVRRVAELVAAGRRSRGVRFARMASRPGSLSPTPRLLSPRWAEQQMVIEQEPEARQPRTGPRSPQGP